MRLDLAVRHFFFVLLLAGVLLGQAAFAGTLVGTTTTLAVTPNPIVQGGNILFTVTVKASSGSVAPTGTANINLGSSTLFTVTLNSSGVGTETLPSGAVPVGTYPLTAVYAGNSTFSGSTSATVNATVQSPVTVTFQAVPNPVAVGQNVQFKATVTAKDGGGTPTGTATFYLGTNSLESATLSSGAATITLPTTGLPTGTYPISAKYNGDTLHAAGSSSATNVTLVSDVSITTTNTLIATDGSPYTETFNATGGTGSYTWSITSGSSALQGIGMSFSSGGVLSGTPGKTGSYQYTVQVKDVETGYTASAPYTLVVNAAPNGSTCAGSYTVSGTISYSGSKTGRIYIGTASNCGGGTQGTSISSAGAFTIRGVSPGTYSLQSFMDVLGYGVANAADPTGSSAAFTVSNSNVTGANITLTDPATVTLSSGPQLRGVAGFNSGAIAFSKEIENNGVEAATSYTLQWSTSSSFSSITGSKTFPATGNNSSAWIVTGNGLTNGTAYYFRAYGTSGGTAVSAYSSVYGPVTIGAPTGGNLVSGSVAFTGTATGPLYVGFLSQTTGGIYIDYVPNPATAQAYSVSVPSDTYQFFAVLDQNNDGVVDAGDVQDIAENGNDLTVTISGATENENLTLPSGNAFPLVNTFNTFNSNNGGNSSYYTYALQPQVYFLGKLPVAVTLLSSSNSDGANIVGPIDVANCQTSGSSCGHGYQFFYQGLPVSATAGDTYSFSVTYSDGSTETLTYTLPEVLNVYATNLAPTTGTTTSTTPTFTWTDPPNAANYEYQFFLNAINNDTGTTIWEIGQDLSGNGFPSTITSIPWGTDPTGEGDTPSVNSLIQGDDYQWQINVIDSYGNQTAAQVNYTP
jgi:hypothetical protein